VLTHAFETQRKTKITNVWVWPVTKIFSANKLSIYKSFSTNEIIFSRDIFYNFERTKIFFQRNENIFCERKYFQQRQFFQRPWTRKAKQRKKVFSESENIFSVHGHGK